ncbi:beta-1,3-glucosyltransferase-like isoform X2 [Nilaparvata lugens]|uniref:beta-1,3-glucosyltransferase-like isoform X2 n=1 Tax=Nilaparvata lugens TaxID=108931 RepID=UPI00193CC296|nr:beta-1,3-glucosyltransferase-like isoform X2 [Nilaparvata lugens]
MLFFHAYYFQCRLARFSLLLTGLVTFIYLCFIYKPSPVIPLRLDDIVVVVLSQGDQYHAAKAEQLSHNILQQAAFMNQAMWMGHGLIDEEGFSPHNASPDHKATPLLKSKYPLFAAGFVMSTALIVKISEIYEEMAVIRSNLSIDASYELALLVDIPLVDLPDKFCIKNRNGCVSFPEKDFYCGDPIPKENIFFAVKTCAKFHQDRVPVVKSTWAKQTVFIEFFSHVQDTEIPTTAVSVNNTKVGHCRKTFEILGLVNERIKKELPSIKWVMMADDDTLISVPGLQSLLSCWPDSGPIAIGERFGYNVQGSIQGYNFLAGGAGIVISASAIPHILKICRCPNLSSTEDMYVGVCLTSLGIPLVHTPSFHQGRPIDYALNYLATHRPVTFHKHKMINPLAVYNEWFSSSDNNTQL